MKRHILNITIISLIVIMLVGCYKSNTEQPTSTYINSGGEIETSTEVDECGQLNTLGCSYVASYKIESDIRTKTKVELSNNSIDISGIIDTNEITSHKTIYDAWEAFDYDINVSQIIGNKQYEVTGLSQNYEVNQYIDYDSNCRYIKDGRELKEDSVGNECMNINEFISSINNIQDSEDGIKIGKISLYDVDRVFGIISNILEDDTKYYIDYMLDTEVSVVMGEETDNITNIFIDIKDTVNMMLKENGAVDSYYLACKIYRGQIDNLIYKHKLNIDFRLIKEEKEKEK